MEKGAPESQSSLSTSRNNLYTATPTNASNPRLYDPNPQYPNEPQMNHQSPPPYHDNFSEPPKAPTNTMYPQPQYFAPPEQPGLNPYPPQPYCTPPQQQPQQQQQQQQQQTTVVVAGDNAPAVVQSPRSYLNFTGALVLSCISIWLCCSVCGCIAFVLAVIGQSSACSGDSRNARHMLYASYGLSIAGTIIFVVIIIVCIFVIPAGVVTAASNQHAPIYHAPDLPKLPDRPDFNLPKLPDLPDFNRATCPPKTCVFGYYLDSSNCKACCKLTINCKGSSYTKNGKEICCD